MPNGNEHSSHGENLRVSKTVLRTPTHKDKTEEMKQSKLVYKSTNAIHLFKQISVIIINDFIYSSLILFIF